MSRGSLFVSLCRAAECASPGDGALGGNGLGGDVADGPALTRVVVLTTSDVDSHVYDALRARASGFLLKNAPPEELVQAIRVVAAGGALLDPAVTRRVIEEFARRPAPGPVPAEADRLTGRKQEVLHLVAQGLSNAEGASSLVVSEATVKTHVARMLTKLGLRDRVQAVVFAYERGLVRPGALPDNGRQRPREV